MGKRSWYYAIAAGHRVGIFPTWTEAQTHVKGYTNAKYKKFALLKDAEAYLTTSSNCKPSITTHKRSLEPDICNTDHGDPRDPKTFVVFCDGSALGNGRHGCRAGYACIFPHQPDWTLSGKLETKDANNVETAPTNNRAEYTAALKAIQRVNESDPSQEKALYIFSDSLLLIRSMTEWITKWQQSNWTKKSKGNDGSTNVKNSDLLKSLLEAKGDRTVIWKHVRAHTGKLDWESEWNQVADDTARAAAMTARA